MYITWCVLESKEYIVYSRNIYIYERLELYVCNVICVGGWVGRWRVVDALGCGDVDGVHGCSKNSSKV